MRKKLIGTLLMGALLGSSTSVFVSCKDYDDDINKNASDISALQTQLTTLETALAEAKAEAAAAKEAADAASSSLDEKIIELLAQMEGADEETKAAIQQQIEDLKSNYATKAELAAANAKVTALETAIEDLKTTSLTEEDVKRIVSEVAGVDPGLLIPALQPYFDAIDVKIAACQNQIENQRNVLNALIEALLGDDVATARIRAALTAIDENGNIDDATLEALKKRMQNISDVVDEIAPEGNVISLFVDKLLKSLVFIPQTYYWGVEAAKIVRLMPQPYVNMKALTNYIDKDSEREEIIGTKRLGSKENNVNYTDVNVDRNEHERYSVGSAITVMLDATAEYHINPSNAKFGDDMRVSVLNGATDFTRAKSTATVSLLGAADKANGGWTVERGILSVPLNVEGTIGTVVDKSDGTPDNTNSGITTFAVQVQYGDTTVTSDYAAIIEETVRDLRLSHKPYKTSGRATDKDFIETGLLNTHCGQCEEYKLSGTPMGMHLFASVDEAKDFVQSFHTGQDLVGYRENINLTALVETHYTTSNNEHAKFEGANFTRNFEYKFELTDFRITAGGTGNNTNESAHAAIYEQDGIYYLHPQDPEIGGLNGKPYSADKATEVVVDRVPLVRVSLVYKPTGDVVDYGYLPIRITKEAEQPKPKDYVYAGYVSEKGASITRYNNCYTEGGNNINFIQTNWRQTEEDLMSHEVFQTTLGRALTRDEFEAHYTAQTNLNDLDQYYLTNEAAYLADPQNVKPVFAAVTTDKNGKVGTIAYVKGGIGTGNLDTSILDWNVTAAEVDNIAKTAGWEIVVRAILLQSDDTATYPDMYVIFTSGKVSIEDKTVEADMQVTAKRINEYWYSAGTFDQGDAEIHTNVKTPEDAVGAAIWKPVEFANTLQYVFDQNFSNGTFQKWMSFSGASTTLGQPFNSDDVTLDLFFDDSNNDRVLKGYLDAGAAKDFKIKNTIISDLSKKNLYASIDNFVTWQRIAYIDGTWDGTDADYLNLQKVKVKLDETVYAKALLNYVDHELIGEEGVLNATVAVLPKVNGTGAPAVAVDDAGKAYINNVVKYEHEGTTDWCKLYIKNYKFDVRYLRPVSLSKLNPAEIEDGTSNVDTKQSIRLSELVGGYTDFRGSQIKPNWKSKATGDNLEYEEYYAPAGATKFAITVVGVTPGRPLSDNANVKTNLNQKDEDTFVPLSTVTSNILFTVDSSDPDVIWYENAGSTVQEFKIQIPVTVEYYWGTIYDNVTVTVKRTKANARQK